MTDKSREFFKAIGVVVLELECPSCDSEQLHDCEPLPEGVWAVICQQCGNDWKSYYIAQKKYDEVSL
jgi:hypothetical protein